MTKPLSSLRRRLDRLVHFDDLSFVKSGIRVSSEDILSQLESKGGTELYLNRYPESYIKNALEEEGILEKIRSLNLGSLIFKMNTSDPFHQQLYIYFNQECPSNLIAQIILSEGMFKPNQSFVKSVEMERLDMLIIEWLCLQNPLEKFLPEKPRLPGQDYPGLGIGRLALNLIQRVARSLKKDGVLNYPQYYHNAALYSEIFKFFNPEFHGNLFAIKKATDKIPLVEAAWIVFTGCLRDCRTKRRFRWKAEEMIAPISKKMKVYFASQEYDRIITGSAEKHSFYVDFVMWNRIKSEYLQ
ncbi:MAG TPA: hypothetical protein VII00_03185 [bacterium]